MKFVKKKDMLRQLFYGDSAGNEAEIMGLSPRFNTIDPNLAQSAKCVLDARGVDSLTSAWIIGWGPRTLLMVTPDGLPPVHSGEIGLVVADFRFAVRIANVELTISRGDLENCLSRALLQLPILGGTNEPDKCRPVIYMNADLRKRLGKDEFRGKFVRMMPIANNEALVV